MRDTETNERNWRSWVRLTFVAVFVGTTIMALVVMLADATRDRDAALRLQGDSSDRIILAATFDATMARSEAALGRFVISGDRTLGSIYSDDWRSSGFLLDRLASASRKDARQAVRIAELRDAWTARGNQLADTALRTTYGQNNEALATYYKIRTSPALSRLEKGIETIILHERSVLSQRTARVDSTVARANLLTTLISIVGVLLVGGIGWLAFASLGASQRRQEEEERAEALENAVVMRTAELTTANERLVDEMATRETAEARLRQAQKMEAVGQLTGGIAHDFNNMLAIVLGGVELAKRRISDGKGDPIHHLDSAMEGANRAAALTKRLLAFARAEPLLPVATDADTLIGGMSDLLDRTLGERITVKHIAGSSSWPIFVDRYQFENAVLNLAVNARDAIEAKSAGGGTVTIATAQVKLTDDQVHELAAGDYVRVAISDTGSGIEPAVLDRVFEPFFTTKAVDKGTGLGLSQVFGYVRQSDGAVTVDSAVGTGTTVSLYLPRCTTRAIPVAAEPAVPVVYEAAVGLRLLVVEDDQRVLAATLEALTELGHTPVGCTNATDAKTALLDNTDIDLVLSDVLMPGMTGPELVTALRVDRPDLRAIFVTGFTGDNTRADAFGDDLVLRKPFTLGALENAIAAATARNRTAALETRAAA